MLMQYTPIINKNYKNVFDDIILIYITLKFNSTRDGQKEYLNIKTYTYIQSVYIYAQIHTFTQHIHTHIHTSYTCRYDQGYLQAMKLPIIQVTVTMHWILTSNIKANNN